MYERICYLHNSLVADIQKEKRKYQLSALRERDWEFPTKNLSLLSRAFSRHLKMASTIEKKEREEREFEVSRQKSFYFEREEGKAPDPMARLTAITIVSPWHGRSDGRSPRAGPSHANWQRINVSARGTEQRLYYEDEWQGVFFVWAHTFLLRIGLLYTLSGSECLTR